MGAISLGEDTGSLLGGIEGGEGWKRKRSRGKKLTAGSRGRSSIVGN